MTSLLLNPQVQTVQTAHAAALRDYRATRTILRIDHADGDPVLRGRLERLSTAYEEALVLALIERDREIDVSLKCAQVVQADAEDALRAARRIDPWTDGAEAQAAQTARLVVDALLFEKNEGYALRNGRAYEHAWHWR